MFKYLFKFHDIDTVTGNIWSKADHVIYADSQFEACTIWERFHGPFGMHPNKLYRIIDSITALGESS